MGDSEDEFDRRGRGRDKFRGERNDFQRREDRRGGADDNKWGGGRENRVDYDRGRGRFSPQRHDGSPPQKRIRTEDGSAEVGPGASKAEPDYPTQPPMMAFKAFLAQQDDNISDEEAIKKFSEYKLDFKKEQIHEFFVAHKEEEWFRAKYHPEECSKKKEFAAKALRARCDAFTKLLENGTVAKVSCDTDKNEALVRLMDAAVILMEDGTDFDLQILDPNYTPETQKPKQPEDKAAAKPEIPVTVTFNKEEEKKEEEAKETEGTETNEEKKEEQKEEKEPGETEEGEEGEAPKEEKKEEPMEESTENGEVTENKEEKEEKEETAPEEQKEKEEKEEEKMEEGEEKPDEKEKPQEEAVEKKKEKEVKPKKGKKRRRDSNDSFTSSSDSDGSFTSSDSESEKSDAEEEKKETKESKEKSSDEEEEKDTTPRPRALHKTQSIFLRNLDPSITKQEVEAMCRQYPGFLRVGLQDPLPERRFFRRGWVTFDRTVNIKDICWNLNNIRLRDCDLGAIVNRELKQRVRPIAGITSHRPVVKADIKHAAKIVQSLDKKTGLWEEPGEKKDKSEKSERRQYGLISRNPVLKNITDYLVDEGSYEEEAYLGAIGGSEETVSPAEQPVERDEENVQVLDRLILYLRIVHSFDFYTAVEYPSEDEMPHRCGIMHARAPPPRIVSDNEVTEYNTVFENKVKAFLNMKSTLSEEEAVRLGKKSNEAESEKFIQANTQELAKDKWLCPLSGKKFKGPEFIRKHIVMKHNDKLDEVKVEVEYFNNYLLDPKRPQLPEFPYQKSRGSGGSGGNSHAGNQGGDTGNYHGSGGGGGGGGYQGGGSGGGYQGGGGYFRPPYQGNWRGGGGGGGGGGGYRRGGGFNNSYGGQGAGPQQRRETGGRGGGAGYMQQPRRDRSRSDPRGIIEYRDLDAPDEADIF